MSLVRDSKGPIGPIGLDDFDIDIDISALLGVSDGTSMLDSRWYELCAPRAGRSAAVQARVDETFRSVLLMAQWRALENRRIERREAARAPIVMRVRVQGANTHEAPPGGSEPVADDSGSPSASTDWVACDISVSGMRCAGTPPAGPCEVEFSIPDAPFPIDATVEAVHVLSTSSVPLVGLRFVSIEPVYRDLIARYVKHRLDHGAVTRPLPITPDPLDPH